VVRAAVNEMKAGGADVVEVAIPNLIELLTDPGGPGALIIRQDFKFDLNAYLAARPTAPIRSLEEVLASGKYHPTIQKPLSDSQAVQSRDTKEYYEYVAKRNTVREAILKAMADNRVDALAYPTITRKANLIGQAQSGSSCKLGSTSGLPAISIPGGFTPDGLPVGVELLGRAWSEPQLIKFAYAYEQSRRHRHPPTSTPALP
jgi:amidase